MATGDGRSPIDKSVIWILNGRQKTAVELFFAYVGLVFIQFAIMRFVVHARSHKLIPLEMDICHWQAVVALCSGLFLMNWNSIRYWKPGVLMAFIFIAISSFLVSDLVYNGCLYSGPYRRVLIVAFVALGMIRLGKRVITGGKVNGIRSRLFHQAPRG